MISPKGLTICYNHKKDHDLMQRLIDAFNFYKLCVLY